MPRAFNSNHLPDPVFGRTKVGIHLATPEAKRFEFAITPQTPACSPSLTNPDQSSAAFEALGEPVPFPSLFGEPRIVQSDWGDDSAPTPPPSQYSQSPNAFCPESPLSKLPRTYSNPSVMPPPSAPAADNASFIPAMPVRDDLPLAGSPVKAPHNNIPASSMSRLLIPLIPAPEPAPGSIPFPAPTTSIPIKAPSSPPKPAPPRQPPPSSPTKQQQPQQQQQQPLASLPKQPPASPPRRPASPPKPAPPSKSTFLPPLSLGALSGLPSENAALPSSPTKAPSTDPSSPVKQVRAPPVPAPPRCPSPTKQLKSQPQPPQAQEPQAQEPQSQEPQQPQGQEQQQPQQPQQRASDVRKSLFPPSRTAESESQGEEAELSSLRLSVSQTEFSQELVSQNPSQATTQPLSQRDGGDQAPGLAKSKDASSSSSGGSSRGINPSASCSSIGNENRVSKLSRNISSWEIAPEDCKPTPERGGRLVSPKANQPIGSVTGEPLLREFWGQPPPFYSAPKGRKRTLTELHSMSQIIGKEQFDCNDMVWAYHGDSWWPAVVAECIRPTLKAPYHIPRCLVEFFGLRYSPAIVPCVFMKKFQNDSLGAGQPTPEGFDYALAKATQAFESRQSKGKRARISPSRAQSSLSPPPKSSSSASSTVFSSPSPSRSPSSRGSPSPSKAGSAFPSYPITHWKAQDTVWVQWESEPWWPALVAEEPTSTSTRVLVHFFSRDSKGAQVRPTRLQPYNPTTRDQLNTAVYARLKGSARSTFNERLRKMKEELEEAMEQAEEHQRTQAALRSSASHASVESTSPGKKNVPAVRTDDWDFASSQ